MKTNTPQTPAPYVPLPEAVSLAKLLAADTGVESMSAILSGFLRSREKSRLREIKALRDALENFCLLVEFSKYDFPPEILPEHKGSMIHVAWESARKALANFSEGGAK